MKVFRKSIAAVLAPVLIGVILAACSDNQSDTSTTTTPTTPLVPTTSEAVTPSSVTSPTPDLAASQAEADRAAAAAEVTRVAAESSAAAQSAADQAAADQAAGDQAAADQAAVDQADASRLASDEDRAAGLQDAATAAGWNGPVCSPDTNLHREEAGQPALTNAELAAECEARIAEAEALIAGNAASPTNLDGNGGTYPDYDAEVARVQGLFGLDRLPTSGEMQWVYGCDAGYITECDFAGAAAGG